MNGPREDSTAGTQVEPDLLFERRKTALGKSFKPFFADLKAMVAFLPLLYYFSFYWRRKLAVRQLLTASAYIFFAASFVLFLAELGIKIFGLELLHQVRVSVPKYDVAVFAAYTLFGYIVVRHSMHAARHRAGEYKLAQILWRFLESPPVERPLQQPAGILQLFLDAFEPYGSLRVSIWLPRDGRLVVPDSCLLTREGVMLDPILCELPLGRGVAGHSFEDSLVRYVPRVHFPFNGRNLRKFSWKFGHAIIFRTKPSPGKPFDVKLDGRGLSVDCVEYAERKAPASMLSFAAFPLRDPSSVRNFGVLCLDFDRTDPLDQVGIQIGVILSHVVGAVLLRQAQSINRASPL